MKTLIVALLVSVPLTIWGYIVLRENIVAEMRAKSYSECLQLMRIINEQDAEIQRLQAN